ncbi:hypothetical protein ACNUDN_29935 [Mycobacterium sp. smrl_JER01]|uniref:hypothetical protein n=1 Tax=Mycobacterium sp. smrl_JER01 TaxID=3402633 RepID=UPI003AD6A8D7
MIGLVVKVECAYSDGHESVTVQDVEVASCGDLDQLWEDLSEYTGDGHDAAGKLGYCHTITVVACPAIAEIVGQSNEWVGA